MSNDVVQSEDRELTVAEKIYELSADIPFPVTEDIDKLADAIIRLAGDIYQDSEVGAAFLSWQEAIAREWCQLRDHVWVHDHCGFWGHQYCERCREQKYPEIPGICSACGPLMHMTEDEYVKSREPQA